MRGSSLTKKALIATVVLLFPVLVALLYGYFNQKKDVELDALADLRAMAVELEEGVSPLLDRAKVRAADFSSDGSIKRFLMRAGMPDGTPASSLNRHLRNNKLPVDRAIEAVYVITPDGRVAASSDPAAVGRDASGEPFFKRGLTGVSLSEGTSWRADAIVASAPVRGQDGSGTLGVVANLMPIIEVARALDERVRYEKTELGYLLRMQTLDGYVVTGGGLLLNHGAAERPVEGREPGAAPTVRSCAGGGRGSSGVYLNRKDEEVIGASVCLRELGWAVVAEIDREEALKNIYPTLRVLLTAGGAAVLIMAAVLLLFFRHVVTPLKNLSRAAGLIRGGRYDVNVPAESKDEIGALADSFNEMAAGIRSRTEALEKTALGLKAAQRIARLCSLEWNVLGGSTRWSDEAASLLGLGPDEPPPDFKAFMTGFIHPDDKARMERAVDDAAFGGAPFSIVCRVTRGDGAIRTVSVDGASATDEAGRPTVMTVTLHDVTEHAEAEEAARKSEERYRDLIEAMSDWVWETDPDGRYTFASRKVMDILGYEPDEVVGKRPHDLMTPEETASGAAFESAMALRRPFMVIETAHRRKDGRAVVIETSGAPFFDKEGRFLGYRGMDRDVTERKRLREQMAHAQKMESIGIFASHLSHDCKNILTVISANAQHLMKRLETHDEDALAASARHIIEASGKGAKLVKDMLMLARSEAPVTRAEDLNAVVRDVVDGALALMELPGVTLAAALAAEGVNVEIDREQMEHVILNLCQNAIDAMPNGGLLSISTSLIKASDCASDADECGCRMDGDSALLTVKDTGIGMDEKTRARVFEPFFTTKGVGKGTGLGLAKAYDIVRQHRGCITVESEPGKGTTFRIFLPCSRKTGV